MHLIKLRFVILAGQ